MYFLFGSGTRVSFFVRAPRIGTCEPPLPLDPLDVPGPALRNIICSTFVTRCGVVQEILAAPGLRNAVMEQLKVVAGEERPWEQVRRDGLGSMIYALGELQGDMCSA